MKISIMVLSLFGLMFVLYAAVVFGQASPSPTPPSFVYAAPTPTPALTGVVIYSTSSPTHGVPFSAAIPKASKGLQVTINGVLVGATNESGAFTLMIPVAGVYALGVEGYPSQTVTVN